METLKIDISKVFGFVPREEIYKLESKVKDAAKALENKTGKGNDFLGWVNLPSSISEADIKDIEQVAARMKKEVDAVVVIGIGGSYLGTRAVSEALSHSFLHLKKDRKNPIILYAGQNIGEDYLNELVEVLDTLRFGIVVISKSGTTTEPALAFRLAERKPGSQSGEGSRQKAHRAITDAHKGALHTTAVQEGYKTYVIPDDVGGRYSVLTPVGLVPLAISGIDIRALIKGAVDMEKLSSSNTPFEKNPSALYAAARQKLYQNGKKVEILANFDNKLHFLAEWWKQLYGESEGKEGKGIFPASVDLTADLHSMGQYIQEGERILLRNRYIH